MITTWRNSYGLANKETIMRVAIAIVVLAVIIVIIGLTLWDYMYKDEFLGKWASVINIISL